MKKGSKQNRGKSFVKGAFCPVKNRQEALIYKLMKIPPIFHWAQAEPTRYRDRSHRAPVIPEPSVRHQPKTRLTLNRVIKQQNCN